MHIRWNAAVAAACLAGLTGCATTPDRSIAADSLRAVLARACAAPAASEPATEAAFAKLANEGFSGAVVALADGRPSFCQATGLAGAGTPYTTALPADVGSIAKPVTALAVLALVERGKLSLDDPLNKWFANVPSDKAAITVRQLLLHQSGLPEYVADTEDYTVIARDAAMAKIFAAPLAFQPGAGWEYSNAGFNVLAALVERASGQSYFAATEALVFAPAGIRASFDPAGFSAVANVPLDAGWRDLRSTAAASRGPFWALWGAGGLYMSAEDLALLMHAFMDGRIVSPAMVAMARQPAVSLNETNAGGLAFGLVKREERWVYYFNGMGEAGSADLWGDPDRGRVLAITANSKKPHAIAAGRRLAPAALPADASATP